MPHRTASISSQTCSAQSFRLSIKSSFQFYYFRLHLDLPALSNSKHALHHSFFPRNGSLEHPALNNDFAGTFQWFGLSHSSLEVGKFKATVSICVNGVKPTLSLIVFQQSNPQCKDKCGQRNYCYRKYPSLARYFQTLVAEVEEDCAENRLSMSESTSETRVVWSLVLTTKVPGRKNIVTVAIVIIEVVTERMNK